MLDGSSSTFRTASPPGCMPLACALPWSPALPVAPPSVPSVPAPSWSPPMVLQADSRASPAAAARMRNAWFMSNSSWGLLAERGPGGVAHVAFLEQEALAHPAIDRDRGEDAAVVAGR